MQSLRFSIRFERPAALVLVAAILSAPMVMAAPQQTPQQATPISEIPDKFVMPEARNDYLKRVEMIPMRDGVKLYTVISFPKGARTRPSS